MKIFLDNKLCDYTELGLSFVYANESASGGVGGAFAKQTLKLPKTKVNDLVLGNILDPRKKKNQNKILCRIENDGLVILSGWAVVASGTINNGSYYELFVVGENSDWGVNIQGKTFSDIDFTEHPFSVAQIQSAITNSFSQGYTYILPKTGEWLPVGFTKYNDHVAAVYVRYVLEQIFLKQGYTIESEFIQSDYFSKLVIPVLNRYYDVEYLAKKLLFAGVNPMLNNIHDLAFAEVIDNNDSYSIATYFVKINGRYNVKSVIQGTDNNGSQGGFYITVVLNGIAQNFNNVSENFELDCLIGDEITFRLYNFNNGSIDDGFLEITYISHISDVPNIEINPNTTISANVWINKLINKWSLSDFINDLKILFNLNITTNVARKTVKIEPKNSWSVSGSNGTGFYSNEIKDLTTTFNTQEQIYTFDTESERYLSIDYIADETVTAFEEKEAIKLYSFEFDKGNVLEGRKEIKLSFFSKSMHISDSEVPGSNNIIPQFPLLFGGNFYEAPNSKNDWANDRAYLLIYEGTINGRECSLWNNNTADLKYEYPFAHMVNYQLLNQNSLSFSENDSSENLLKFQNLARAEDFTRLTIQNLWSNLDLSKSIFDKKYYLFETLWTLVKIDGVNPLSKKAAKTIFEKLNTQNAQIYTGGSKLKGLINV